jgi:hypothetical protein
VSLRAHAAAILAVLPQEAREVAILAGGALRAYYDKTEIKDYDLFFRGVDDAEAAERALLGAGWHWEDANTGGNSVWRSPCGKLFNLICFTFGTPEEHVNRFDFRCCQIAAWLDGGKLHMLRVSQASIDAKKKRLRLVNNNGTERTAKRIERYEQGYGYTLSGLRKCPVNRPARIRRYVARRPVSQKGGY